jgi:hypothetical protein
VYGSCLADSGSNFNKILQAQCAQALIPLVAVT